MDVDGLLIAAALDNLPLRLANDFVFVCNSKKRSAYLTGDSCWPWVLALCLFALNLIFRTIKLYSYLL